MVDAGSRMIHTWLSPFGAVWGRPDWVVEVSGSLAMNEQVSSSIIVSSSDCLETDFSRISDSCLHLATLVSSVFGS